MHRSGHHNTLEEIAAIKEHWLEISRRCLLATRFRLLALIQCVLDWRRQKNSTLSPTLRAELLGHKFRKARLLVPLLLSALREPLSVTIVRAKRKSELLLSRLRRHGTSFKSAVKCRDLSRF